MQVLTITFYPPSTSWTDTKTLNLHPSRGTIEFLISSDIVHSSIFFPDFFWFCLAHTWMLNPTVIQLPKAKGPVLIERPLDSQDACLEQADYDTGSQKRPACSAAAAGGWGGYPTATLHLEPH